MILRHQLWEHLHLVDAFLLQERAGKLHNPLSVKPLSEWSAFHLRKF